MKHAAKKLVYADIENLLENLEEAILTVEENGRIVSATKPIAEITGFEPAELVSKDLSFLVHPDDVGIAEKVLHPPKTVELRLIGKRGLRWAKVHSAPGKGLVFLILKDLTELKEKEELLAKLEKKTLSGIYVVQDGRFVYVNKRMAELTGYSEEELLGMSPLDLDIRVPQHEARCEVKILTKSCGEKWLDVIASEIEFNGKPAILGSVVDVTHRKSMEKELRRTEERYQSLLEAIDDIVFVLDTEGRFRFLNKKFEELTQYSVGEWIGRRFVELIAPEYREAAVERFMKTSGETRLEESPLYEVEILRKDGKRIPVELNLAEFYGEVYGKIGIARDISKRKEMEVKILESEEMFRKLAEKSLVGIYLIQDGVFKYVNPNLAQLWGYSVEELIGKSPLELVHPDDRSLVERNLKLRIEGKLESIRYKLRVITKKGETRVNEVFGSRIIYRGKPAVIGTLIDVTESEKQREELERYKRFYENARDLFFILDSKARFVEVNPRYAELLGYKKEELIGHTARRFFHPSELDLGREMFRRVMNGERVDYEARAISKDKKKVYFTEISLWPIIEGRKVVGAEGIVRDITEKKRLENELKRSEEKYRLIVENSRDVIKVVDRNGKRIYVSPSAEKVFGYRAEEMIGRSVFENVHPEDVERVKSEFYSAIKEKRAGRAVYRYRKKDGKYIWAESVGTPIVKDGNVEGGVIVTRDITERVELEERLRRSEEKYRKTAEYLQNLIDVAPIPITSWDSNFRITLWNKAAEEQFGWKAKEVMGRSILEFQVPDEERERVRRLLEEIEEGKPVININPTLTKNGERRIFEWYNFAIGKGKEKITTSIGIDLTERIEMERILSENEQKFRKLFETTPNLIAILDEDGTFIEANPAMIKSIGFNPVGKKLTEIFHPHVAEKRLSKIRSAIRRGKKIETEDSVDDRYYHNIFIPLRLGGKRYCFVLTRDVTRFVRLNKLLNAINEVNKLVVYERKKKPLLEKACKILSSLREYSVWIGLLEEGKFVKIAGEMHAVEFSADELPKCLADAMDSVRILGAEERSGICRCEIPPHLSCTVVPMRVEGDVKGFVIVHSDKMPRENEIEMFQTLADDLAFAIKSIELEEARKKAYQQIEKNIEQYAILVDQIRNPLAIIAGLIELKADDRLRKDVGTQVERIERLIRRLDRGWLESESVREFLRKT